jgi:hypothetical protein
VVLFSTVAYVNSRIYASHFAANDSQPLYGSSHFPRLFVFAEPVRHYVDRGLSGPWPVSVSFGVGLNAGWNPNTARVLVVWTGGIREEDPTLMLIRKTNTG